MYQYIRHNFNIRSHSPDILLSPNYLIKEMTISAEGNPHKTQNCDGGNVDDDFKKIGTENNDEKNENIDLEYNDE